MRGCDDTWAENICCLFKICHCCNNPLTMMLWWLCSHGKKCLASFGSMCSVLQLNSHMTTCSGTYHDVSFWCFSYSVLLQSNCWALKTRQSVLQTVMLSRTLPGAGPSPVTRRHAICQGDFPMMSLLYIIQKICTIWWKHSNKLILCRYAPCKNWWLICIEEYRAEVRQHGPMDVIRLRSRVQNKRRKRGI